MQRRVQRDNGYCRLAAEYVSKQVGRLPRELRGVRRPKDLKRLHQARVLSRRLRVALNVYGEAFGAKRAKRWRKALKRLLKTLGPARDADVQADLVSRRLGRVRDRRLRPGLERLLLRLHQQRRALQPKVVRAMQRFTEDGVLGEMRAAVRRLRAGLPKDATARATPVVRRLAHREIEKRLRAVQALADSLEDPSAMQRHHAMRIAVKHLRYALETFAQAYGRSAKPFITEAKQLQTLLGDVHDCDVWAVRLEQFLIDERGRTKEYFGTVRPAEALEPGLAWFAEDRRAAREKVFKKTVRRWQALERQGCWDDLRTLLTTGAGADADSVARCKRTS